MTLVGCAWGNRTATPTNTWNSSSGTWNQPGMPPPPRPIPPPSVPPNISVSPRVADATPSPVPNGWVNYGGLVLPSIPGLTVPLSNSANGAASSAFAASLVPSNSPPPPGWVNWRGVLVPAIPGLTVPMSNAGGGPPGNPAIAGNVPTSPQGGCGRVTVGQRTFALDCMTPNYGEIPWASFLALDRRLLSASRGFAGATPMPTTVDHRQDGTEGLVRNQGQVGACTAFSFVAAVDHALARASGAAARVSVMHVWSRYHKSYMEAAASNNVNKYLTLESAWPFDETAACAWECQDRGLYGGVCADINVACAEPSPVQVSDADGKPSAKVVGITRLDITDFEGIRAVIAKGQDIWFSMHVDHNVFSKIPSRTGIAIPDGDFRTGSGHAMLLAGYTIQPAGTYYLIHNSWGTDWADHGYAWIGEDTLKRNIVSAYLVEAAAASPMPGPTPVAPTPQQPACPDNLKPDTASGSCAPPCPDGSPRHANACPVASQCPTGYVNVSGACVFAAPNISGQDARTHIWFSCSAGGCTYIIPWGQAGCSLPFCGKSCPPPNYHLAVAQNQFSCVE